MQCTSMMKSYALVTYCVSFIHCMLSTHDPFLCVRLCKVFSIVLIPINMLKPYCTSFFSIISWQSPSDNCYSNHYFILDIYLFQNGIENGLSKAYITVLSPQP